jgi:capsular polysaccharide biosynthesis protein
MELKDYLKIFVKNLVWFSLVLLLAMAIGAGYKHYKNSQPSTYQVSLLLNVTRTGIQATDNYRYDDFYRLQADERFADTVVRWIETPRIVTDVYNETGMISGGIALNELSNFFGAKRLSSQAIEVNFTAKSAVEAQNLSENLVKAINSEIKNLNQFQKEESWFKIIGDEPVIKEYKITWKNVLLISIALGIFLGIWVMLIKHYLTRE